MFLRKMKRQQGSNHGCLCSKSGLSEFGEKRQGYKFARKKERKFKKTASNNLSAVLC